MKDKKLHCKCFVRVGQPNKREEDEGEEEKLQLCWVSPDKHSASVQPHSSTGGAGKEEEEGEDLNIEPVPFSYIDKKTVPFSD